VLVDTTAFFDFSAALGAARDLDLISAGPCDFDLSIATGALGVRGLVVDNSAPGDWAGGEWAREVWAIVDRCGGPKLGLLARGKTSRRSGTPPKAFKRSSGAMPSIDVRLKDPKRLPAKELLLFARPSERVRANLCCSSDGPIEVRLLQGSKEGRVKVEGVSSGVGQAESMANSKSAMTGTLHVRDAAEPTAGDAWATAGPRTSSSGKDSTLEEQLLNFRSGVNCGAKTGVISGLLSTSLAGLLVPATSFAAGLGSGAKLVMSRSTISELLE